jgi:NADH:ubiquinone oxidoreductase subunit 3 (subunit A)
VTVVVADNYRDLFVAIGTCAATLIGLLFVAMSIAQDRALDRPQEIREFRAAAALLAFTNAFTVSLFGLVPGTNIGYPAAIVGAGGVLFTAGGVRAIISLHLPRRQHRSQLLLLFALLLLFGIQLVFGVQLLVHPRQVGDVGYVADVLIASLLIGIGRAWEFVGQWDTGILSSIGRLMGHPNRMPDVNNDGREAPSRIEDV